MRGLRTAARLPACLPPAFLLAVCKPAAAGAPLTRPQAALAALDVDKKGQVRFNDWVAWWVGKGRPSSPAPAMRP